MIDTSHLPDHKYFLLIRIILIPLSILDINLDKMLADPGLVFILFMLGWIIKVIIGIYAMIGIYEYFKSSWEYKQWKRSGFDPKKKDEFRIK